MADEMTPYDSASSRSRTSGSGTSQPPQKVVKFWAAMLELFGTRWTENYGQTPSELWTSAIMSLTSPELKMSLRQLMTRGSAHPPTLPQFLELARVGSGKKTSPFPEQFTPEWHEQRREVMAQIAKQSAERGVLFTPEQRRTSIFATRLSELSNGMTGYDESRRDYERDIRCARLIAENVNLPTPSGEDTVITAPRYVPAGSAYLHKWKSWCTTTPFNQWPKWLQTDPVAAEFLRV